MPARIPLDLVDPPRRRLRDLRVGEQCDVIFTAMRVDEQGRGFLDPSELIREKAYGTTINVRRDSAGYHVTLERRPFVPFLRKPKHSFWAFPFERWIVVESFTELEVHELEHHK